MCWNHAVWLLRSCKQTHVRCFNPTICRSSSKPETIGFLDKRLPQGYGSTSQFLSHFPTSINIIHWNSIIVSFYSIIPIIFHWNIINWTITIGITNVPKNPTVFSPATTGGSPAMGLQDHNQRPGPEKDQLLPSEMYSAYGIISILQYEYYVF